MREVALSYDTINKNTIKSIVRKLVLIAYYQKKKIQLKVKSQARSMGEFDIYAGFNEDKRV